MSNTTPAPLIRPCSAADLPQLQSLLEELARWAQARGGFPLERLEAQLELMDGRPETYANRVAVLDGRVIGFLSAVFYHSFFHAGGTALINELAVHPAHQRRGVGRRLVEWLQEEALRRGMDEIEVGTDRENRRAQQFYRACGFPLEYILFGRELR